MKVAEKSQHIPTCICDIVKLAKSENDKSLHGGNPTVRAFIMSRFKELDLLGYRKVSYLEQCWYILKYKLQEWRDKHHAKKG